MSPELIGILSVGAALFVGLGGLVLTLQSRTDKRLDALRAELWAELQRLAERMGALERGQARIEGLIEGSGLFRPGESMARGD